MSRLSETIQKYPKFESDIKLIAAADPSGKQKYLAWAAKQLSNKVKVETLIDVLKKFHEKSPRLTKKDINAYKNVADLQRALRPAKDSNSKQRELAAKFAPIVFEDKQNNIIVRRIDSVHAMKIYGAGTKWCITDKETFYNYEYRDPYILFVGNRKFCMISRGDEIYNEQDESVHLKCDCDDCINFNKFNIKDIIKKIQKAKDFAKDKSPLSKMADGAKLKKVSYSDYDIEFYKIYYKDIFNLCETFDFNMFNSDVVFYNKIFNIWITRMQKSCYNVSSVINNSRELNWKLLTKENIVSIFKTTNYIKLNLLMQYKDNVSESILKYYFEQNCGIYTTEECFFLLKNLPQFQDLFIGSILGCGNIQPNMINYLLKLDLDFDSSKLLCSLLVKNFNKSQLNKVLEIYKCSKKGKKK